MPIYRIWYQIMAFGSLTPTDNSELRIIFNTSVHEHIICNINNSNSNNNQITVVLWYMYMANKPSSRV